MSFFTGTLMATLNTIRAVLKDARMKEKCQTGTPVQQELCRGSGN